MEKGMTLRDGKQIRAEGESDEEERRHGMGDFQVHYMEQDHNEETERTETEEMIENQTAENSQKKKERMDIMSMFQIMIKKMDESKEEIKREMNTNSQRMEEKIEDMRKQLEEVRSYAENKIQETKQEIRDEMLGRLMEVEEIQSREMENIKKNENEFKMEIKNIQGKIEQIEKKGMSMEYVGGVKTIYGATSQKFDGNIKKLHPKIFIRILKNRIRGINNIEDIKEIIRDHLENHALIWFSAREKDMSEFQDFETAFLQYFWGENTQSTIREQLYFGKFDENRSHSLNNYAIQLHAMTQYLEPPIPEEEIVMFIARHFKAELAETIAIQNIRKLDQLSMYLQRVERNLIRHENSQQNIRTNYRNNENNQRNNNQNNNLTNNRFNNNRNYNNNAQINNNNNYNNNNYNNRNYNTNTNNRSNNDSYRQNNYNDRNNRQYRGLESRNSEGNMQRGNGDQETRRVNFQRINQDRRNRSESRDDDVTNINETRLHTAQIYRENTRQTTEQINDNENF